MMLDTRKIAVATALMLPLCWVVPAAAQTYPADKPELEYLDYWRLDTNYPTAGRYTDAKSKSPKQLDTYTDPLFRVITGGGVQMDARFGGAVTSTGTAYPRTELREMASAKTEADWDCKSKAKTMSLQLRIKQTPRYKPEMSVAQIHDADSDNLEVLYVYDKAQNGNAFPAPGTLGDKGKIIVKFNGGRSPDEVLDTAHVVGDKFQLTVHANDTFAGKGKMAVEYTNVSQGKSKASTKVSFDSSTQPGCYFKAGNYAQACTRKFIDGSTNPTCNDKDFPLSNGYTWEPDASRSAVSTMVLYNLTVNPKGN
ncbi:polysaccharide lyase family 7 protein [Ideonella sp. DXS29W]|uniref:Polysaccharide lyase family 7 protein n=1 Tax=Ideonella lacteola TaxID=2984193 RepID=A0ABU9BT53_9BURK